jgi:hypothetical protein
MSLSVAKRKPRLISGVKDDARCGALLSSGMNAVRGPHGHNVSLDRCTNLL